MLIFWRIKQLSRKDRRFSDRDLFLDTSRLNAATRAALELVAETASSSRREFLNHRHLFQDDKSTDASAWFSATGGHSESFTIPDYFEDENGKEISPWELGPILTGDPNAIMLPFALELHDLELQQSQPEPVPVDGINLTEIEFKQLSFFCRDLHELLRSPLLVDGPGSLKSTGKFGKPKLVTGVSNEEIHSAAMIFRRLFMEQEPGNFAKAANIYTKYFHKHPYGKWLGGARKSFLSKLDKPPEFVPLAGLGALTFTRRQLLNAFIYTRLAHQPTPDSEADFKECLQQVNGDMQLLTWLFLNQLWLCSLEIKAAGRPIAAWFHQYCGRNKLDPDLLPAIRDEISGIGAKEKKADRDARLFRRKAEELAAAIWNERGKPEGGPQEFLSVAIETLEQARQRTTLTDESAA